MIGRLGLKRLLIGCLAHLSKITSSELMVTDLKSSLDLGFLAWNSKSRINGSQNRTSAASRYGSFWRIPAYPLRKG